MDKYLIDLTKLDIDFWNRLGLGNNFLEYNYLGSTIFWRINTFIFGPNFSEISVFNQMAFEVLIPKLLGFLET